MLRRDLGSPLATQLPVSTRSSSIPHQVHTSQRLSLPRSQPLQIHNPLSPEAPQTVCELHDHACYHLAGRIALGLSPALASIPVRRPPSQRRIASGIPLRRNETAAPYIP